MTELSEAAARLRERVASRIFDRILHLDMSCSTEAGKAAELSADAAIAALGLTWEQAAEKSIDIHHAYMDGFREATEKAERVCIVPASWAPDAGMMDAVKVGADGVCGALRDAYEQMVKNREPQP